MSLQHYYNGTLLTTAVQLRSERGFSAKAEIGEVDTITLEVEDPSAAYDFIGLKSWRIVETACQAARATVWYGYVWRQSISRGEGDEGDTLELTSTARRWELELVEANNIVGRRVFTATTADRPTETVSARLTWLLTTPGFTGVVADRGLIEASTLSCDGRDYRGLRGTEVLRDIALVTGFNYYVRYHDATGALEIAFYSKTSNLDTSTLAISNVKADIDDAVTWAPSTDATLKRDPSRIASGVWLAYSGGTFYTSDAATATTFSDIDQIAPTAAVTTKTAASTLAARFLEEHDEQDERIVECRLMLPHPNLNDVRQGQRITARFAHLPGWETARYCRVVSKTFGRPAVLGETMYEVLLELVPVTLVTATASHARVMRPNDNYVIVTNSEWKFGWDWDGDATKPGDAHDYKYGLVNYYPVGSKPANGWEGIVCLGSGTVDIELRADAASVVTGTQTCTFTVYRNSVDIGSNQEVTTGGLRIYNPSLPVTLTGIAVSTNDVITARLKMEPGPEAFQIPGGVGQGWHRLMVTGELV